MLVVVSILVSVAGCFGDVTDVRLEGESGVKDESKVSDLRGGGERVTVNGECEVLGGGEEGFGTNDDKFGFVAVEFREVGGHP